MLKRLSVLGLTALIVLLTLTAGANPPGPPSDRGPGGPGPAGGPGGPGDPLARLDFRQVDQLAPMLELTSQQQDALRNLLIDSTREQIRLKGDLDLKQFELSALMSQDRPDEASVLQLAEEVSQLRSRTEVGRIKTTLGVKQILSSEQQKKLRQGPQRQGPGARPPGPRGEEPGRAAQRGPAEP